MSMGAEEAIGAAGADVRLIRYIDWTTAHAADLMTSASPPTFDFLRRSLD